MVRGYFIDKDGQVYCYNSEEKKFEKPARQEIANKNSVELDNDTQERE